MPKEALDTPLEIIREKKLMFYGPLKNGFFQKKIQEVESMEFRDVLNK